MADAFTPSMRHFAPDTADTPLPMLLAAMPYAALALYDYAYFAADYDDYAFVIFTTMRVIFAMRYAPCHTRFEHAIITLMVYFCLRC